MTIGTRTAGAWAAGSTSISTNLPTSVAAGDMMVLFVGCKPYNATIADISGWTRLGTQQTNGTTGAGTDTGSVAWTVFYRQFVNGDAAPTVSITSGNTALACIFGFTKTESAWATPVAYFGSDTSSGTDYSITAASSSGLIKAGDYLCSGTILAGNDADLATPTCSATGATIGTVTLAPGTNGSTNTGTDCRAGGFYAPVTAGISSADAVVGWTLSANQTGGTALVRVRETNQTVAPTTGTLRTVGQDPTVTVPAWAVPTAGALVFAGQQPTVELGSLAVTVSPTVGTLRLVGQTPTTRLVDSWIALVPGINTWAPRYQIGGTDESPSVGTLRFVGQAPTVSTGADVTVSPTVGALVIAGQQPTVNQTWSADPSTGTFRLVGQQPSVEQDWTVAPTVGTVRFVGQDPTVTVTQNLYASPEAGTLRVEGQQPSVAQTYSASPTAGALRFDGQQPGVTQDWTAAPTAGVLRLAGQQPTVVSGDDRLAQPSTGIFRIEGLAPTVTQDWTVAPVVGEVRLVGQAPTVETTGPVEVTPASGLLRFVGQAPQIVVPGLEAEQPSGGWAAYNQSALDRAERIRREIQDERERQELADRLEAELRREGVLADSEAERLRLAALAAQYQDAELPNRVRRALRYAQRAETDLAIELALREFRRLQEEEELAVLMALVLD